MHLADGIVSQPTLLIGSALIAAGVLSTAIRRAFSDDVDGIAWTGTLAAFVLAAQMINVPIVPGASGHVVGAGLLTIVLGPARAIVALAAVLAVQALLLADGGITALGMNVIDIAVIPALVVSACRRAFDASPSGLFWAGIVGTSAGSAAGAACLALVLIASAGAPAAWTFAWLVGVQALVGLAEGVLTGLAARKLAGVAPALTKPRRVSSSLDPDRSAGRSPALGWAAIAVGFLIVLAPWATNDPDALEVVVERLSP